MIALKIAFWICLFIVFYTYVGYGMLLWLLVRLKRIIRGKATPLVLPAEDDLPDVTFIICAYNEEDVVAQKMANTRELDYPADKLHVMWVTDGSTDGTNDRLRDYPEVQIVFTPERKGKTAALNHGIGMVTTPLTMMTDANTMVNREAVCEIVRCFQDPQVACVAGEKRVIARNDSEAVAEGAKNYNVSEAVAEGEGLYWRYESALKRMDSELYSAMGAAGELNAIRTALYRPMPENALLDDFVMSMRMVDEGNRIAYTSDAYAMEYGSADLQEESKRKRRIAAGGLQSVWWLKNMMNPFNHFVVAFQFVSHRVLRWTITPFTLLALIPLNIALVVMGAGCVYTVILLLQALFYLAALCSWILERQGHKNRLLYVPYYFLFMNLNVFRGFKYLYTHRGGGTWEKAKRG
jgi:cellulose synthase/poly-beta-1,6-N-acetylglucosamine synthase-like glycosyltransferase